MPPSTIDLTVHPPEAVPHVQAPAVADTGDRPRSLKTKTFDDHASLAGSAAASLALVWIVYEQALGLDGILGFIVCWYAAFLVLYGIVTSLTNGRVVVVDRLVAAVVYAAALVVGVALATTIVYVFIQGWPALSHLNFYTQDMAGVRPTSPLTEGGVLHAIVGTIVQLSIAVAIALPFGVATAVYMTEVGGRLSNAVRTVIEAMTALPDVLAGLFVYAVLIIGLQWERDGFAVSIALAITMLPVVARSAEVVLKVVPHGLREAGWALGASKWQTVRRVVLPTAKAGLGTSLILGIARICGETAPLLIVSGASTFFNANPVHEPMNSLPLYIFTAVRSGEPNYITRGYGAAALLMAIILFLFVLTRVIARDKGGRR